jgi:antitoxin (DNA-binding transcriptional repressor) of toxin-antitoxin stability system
MNTIDVQQIPSRWNECLTAVSSGATVVVTEGGRPVAELGPLSAERRAIMDLVDQGLARWSGGKPQGLRGVAGRGAPVSDAVIEDRR